MEFGIDPDAKYWHDYLSKRWRKNVGGPKPTSAQLAELVGVLNYEVRKGNLKPVMTPDGIFTFIVPHYGTQDWSKIDEQNSVEQDATYNRTKAKQ